MERSKLYAVLNAEIDVKMSFLLEWLFVDLNGQPYKVSGGN